TEAGYPDLGVDGFQGFFGWRDMPDALRDRIAADVRAVAADPALGERLNAIGQAVRVGTTQDFVAMITEQRGKIARIATAIGLKPQRGRWAWPGRNPSLGGTRRHGEGVMRTPAARATAFASFAALIFVAMSLPAQAQAWPQRPVKFIVPFGPGAGVDIGARLVA